MSTTNGHLMKCGHRAFRSSYPTSSTSLWTNRVLGATALCAGPRENVAVIGSVSGVGPGRLAHGTPQRQRLLRRGAGPRRGSDGAGLPVYGLPPPARRPLILDSPPTVATRPPHPIPAAPQLPMARLLLLCAAFALAGAAHFGNPYKGPCQPDELIVQIQSHGLA